VTEPATPDGDSSPSRLERLFLTESLRRYQGEVKVIRHDNIGINQPMEARAGLIEAAFECRRRTPATEQLSNWQDEIKTASITSAKTAQSVDLPIAVRAVEMFTRHCAANCFKSVVSYPNPPLIAP